MLLSAAVHKVPIPVHLSVEDAHRLSHNYARSQEQQQQQPRFRDTARTARTARANPSKEKNKPEVRESEESWSRTLLRTFQVDPCVVQSTDDLLVKLLLVKSPVRGNRGQPGFRGGSCQSSPLFEPSGTPPKNKRGLQHHLATTLVQYHYSSRLVQHHYSSRLRVRVKGGSGLGSGPTCKIATGQRVFARLYFQSGSANRGIPKKHIAKKQL